jgi:hypothetical protein
MRDPMIAVREHLVRVLAWEDAHVGFDKAVDGIPPESRGRRAPGLEHSPWQLLEHLRLAQEDILDFCVNPSYAHTMTWPDDYWPKDAAPPREQAWRESVAAYVRSRDALAQLAREVDDLAARVPTGEAQRLPRRPTRPGAQGARDLARRVNRHAACTFGVQSPCAGQRLSRAAGTAVSRGACTPE